MSKVLTVFAGWFFFWMLPLWLGLTVFICVAVYFCGSPMNFDQLLDLLPIIGILTGLAATYISASLRSTC